MPVLLAAGFLRESSSIALLALFAIAGMVSGVQDTLEAAATSEFVAERERGLGFGLLGAVNGVGDLVSSVVVGALWTFHPALGFGYAAVCMAGGAALVTRGDRRDRASEDG